MNKVYNVYERDQDGLASPCQLNANLVTGPTGDTPTKETEANDQTQNIKGQLLAIMTVEFGNQNFEEIYICENDNPEAIAEQFCLKHNFEDNVKEILVDNIRINKQLAQEDQLRKLNQMNQPQLQFYNNSNSNNQYYNYNQNASQQLSTTTYQYTETNTQQESDNYMQQQLTQPALEGYPVQNKSISKSFKQASFNNQFDQQQIPLRQINPSEMQQKQATHLDPTIATNFHSSNYQDQYLYRIQYQLQEEMLQTSSPERLQGGKGSSSLLTMNKPTEPAAVQLQQQQQQMHNNNNPLSQQLVVQNSGRNIASTTSLSNQMNTPPPKSNNGHSNPPSEEQFISPKSFRQKLEELSPQGKVQLVMSQGKHNNRTKQSSSFAEELAIKASQRSVNKGNYNMINSSADKANNGSHRSYLSRSTMIQKPDSMRGGSTLRDNERDGKYTGQAQLLNTIKKQVNMNNSSSFSINSNNHHRLNSSASRQSGLHSTNQALSFTKALEAGGGVYQKLVNEQSQMNSSETKRSHIWDGNRVQRSRSEVNYVNQQLTFTPNINPVSKQIFEEKFRNLQPVFERLYKHASTKQQLVQEYIEQNSLEYLQQQPQQLQQSNEKALSKSRSSSQKIMSERLFSEAKLKQEKIKQNYIKLVKAQELEDLKECTHHPQINLISDLIIQKKREVLQECSPELRKGKFTQFQREIEKAKMIQSQMKQCSFKPLINQKSQQLLNKKQNLTSDIFENLFEDAKRKQNVVETQQSPPRAEGYTFKPQINELSNKLVQGKSFNERQENYKIQKHNKSYIELRKRSQSPVDPQTGHQLFQPQVGRSPLKQRQTNNVYEHLYQLHKMDGRNIETIRNLIEKDNQQQSFKVNSQSRKILENLKQTKIYEIFQALDGDQDGNISVGKISIRAIPPNVLEVISPVLFEMEEFNFSLNLPEFNDAINRLIKTLNSSQKADLFSYSKKLSPVTNENFSFVPRINKLSEEILRAKKMTTYKK